MAQVVPDTRTESDIDYQLNYQFMKWQSVPEVAEWWPDMDGVDKEVFHLEWSGITQSRLDELQRWAEQGLLTATQRARYEELRRLVARYRPLIEQLLGEGEGHAREDERDGDQRTG